MLGVLVSQESERMLLFYCIENRGFQIKRKVPKSI